jgi:hypothetical protein
MTVAATDAAAFEMVDEGQGQHDDPGRPVDAVLLSEPDGDQDGQRDCKRTCKRHAVVPRQKESAEYDLADIERCGRLAGKHRGPSTVSQSTSEPLD